MGKGFTFCSMFDLIVWMSFFMEFKTSCSCFLFSNSLFCCWFNVFSVFNMFALWLWSFLFSYLEQYQWTAEYFDRIGRSLTSIPPHVPCHQPSHPLHEIKFFLFSGILALHWGHVPSEIDWFLFLVPVIFWKGSSGPLQVNKDSENYPVERSHFDFLFLRRAVDVLFLTCVSLSLIVFE